MNRGFFSQIYTNAAILSIYVLIFTPLLCLLPARAAGNNKSLIKIDFQVKIFIRFEMFDNKTISSFCRLIFINTFWAYTFQNLSDIFLS